MKKIIILSITIACFSSTYGQKTKVCCSKPIEGSLAMWVNKEGFSAAHLSPEPFDFKATTGEMIQFDTPDGKKGNAFAVKSGANNGKAIIMVHEWWGLNDYIKKEAETLASELGAVDVYAVDLYDGKVATNPDEAGKLMGGMDPARAATIIKGILKYIGPKAQIGTIGWCMGGFWSFQTALLGGKQIKACVMYYGFPETDKNKIKTLSSDVLYISAENDGFIKKENREQFYSDLKSLNKQITVKKYEADHAFANPSNPKYSKDFADDAHKIVLDYLYKGLGLK
ncbi:MAG: dienelactone hydrolase family protein [Bacteroidota bacterium]|nr:dienelactone hydrolase family protein [Bacteroidota bacterium]